MHGIRQVAPGLHITIKINCNDFTYGVLEEEERLAICKILAAEVSTPLWWSAGFGVGKSAWY